MIVEYPHLKNFFSFLSSSRATQASLIGLVTIYLLRKIKERSKIKQITSGYETAIEQVRREREESLEWARQQSKLISDEEREKIEKMDFTQLRDSLQSGSISCESVVRVYYGLALKSHEKTNCLTNIIKSSLDLARCLDEHAKDPHYQMGSLHGIPISVKEAIMVKGQRYTWGLAQKADYVSEEDSYTLTPLIDQGMIPFCTTNVPTSCMTYNCSNGIYGTTTNPHNSSRTSGGSSGGEGALISSGGSIIGMGSDIGGSIRIPAAYSGCCGFKPSSTRMSTLQMVEPLPMRPFLMPSEGPLSRDPHSIVAAMKSIWSDHSVSNEDPFSVPVSFREDLFKQGRKFRIGYYTSDGYLDPLPGNQRVVREAVEVLKAQGHTLIPFSIESICHGMVDGVFTAIFADGGASMTELLKYEPLPPVQLPLREFARMPMWKKKVLGWLSKLVGDTKTAGILLGQATSAIDVQRGIDAVYAGRKNLVRMMKESEIDLLLCPATMSPALPHTLPNLIPFNTIWSTMIFNACDFPAGVVTTSKWNEMDEKELESYEEKGLVEREVKKACKGSIGLPLAVQIAAPPCRDEMVLRVMVDLYDGLKK